MARLVSLNKVPANGVFALPTAEEVELFENRFCEIAGFSLPKSRRFIRGAYDRSLRGFFCFFFAEEFFKLLSSKTLVIYLPHE